VITFLHELPIALAEARIAARLTQRQLAERIGVAEQQVQRWEANDYTTRSGDSYIAGAGFEPATFGL
jgi:HTH-type transcriptional regulator/antitoxin HipB